jgi:hypothetical protein
MDEPVPREIVEVASAAGEQETGRNGIGVAWRRISARTTTPPMDEPRELVTEPVRLEFKEAGIERRKQAALHAPHPARERLYRNADVCLRGEGVDIVLVCHRGHAQGFDLSAERPAHVGEQPSLLDGLTAITLPSVDAHRHDR